MALFLSNLEVKLMNTIFQFMKRNYKVILAVLAFSLLLWGFIPKEDGNNPEKDKTTISNKTIDPS